MEERLIRTEMLLGEAAMGRLARAHVLRAARARVEYNQVRKKEAVEE